MQRIVHDWLIGSILLALAIGGALGFWYGLKQGEDIGYQQAQADMVIDAMRREKRQAEAVNPFNDISTNVFSEVKTNPYDQVKLNPFE